MSFDTGGPLPATEEDTTEWTLYHALTVEFQVVTFERRDGQWYWMFIAHDQRIGRGSWMDVRQVLCASGGSPVTGPAPECP